MQLATQFLLPCSSFLCVPVALCSLVFSRVPHICVYWSVIHSRAGTQGLLVFICLSAEQNPAHGDSMGKSAIPVLLPLFIFLHSTYHILIQYIVYLFVLFIIYVFPLNFKCQEGRRFYLFCLLLHF